MKRKFLIKSALTLMLICATITAVFLGTAAINGVEATVSYTDVAEIDWFYENVKYVTENGIMNGVEGNRFAPKETLSRAMSVTILYRLAGEPSAKGSHSFADVKSGEWYSDAVAWAYENKITTGKSAAFFAPNDEVTRAEFVSFLCRYAYYAEIELPAKRNGSLRDSMLTPAYAKEAEMLLYRAEVINGLPGDVFKYYAPISRAEAAAMINRLVNNSVPIDTGEYTYVVFIGNSINGTGNIPIHFKAIADDDKMKVYSYDHCETPRVTAEHCEWFRNNMHPDTKISELCDIFIIQEGGGSFPSVGENESIRKLFYSTEKIPSGFANGFFTGENEVENLMDQLGRNKDYYTFTAAPRYGIFDEYDTELLLGIKKVFEEEYNLPLTYASDVSGFNKDLNLTMSDTYPDGLHPTRLMGYVAALALYCDIYDVSPIEQNNGDLKADEIPGSTQAEKDAFMVELKQTVQDILDVQNITK